MNRTINDATVKTYYIDDLENPKVHVMAFVTAYNFAKHLKTLRWRTPSRPSVRPGLKTHQSSRLTRTNSSRDHTLR